MEDEEWEVEAICGEGGCRLWRIGLTLWHMIPNGREIRRLEMRTIVWAFQYGIADGEMMRHWLDWDDWMIRKEMKEIGRQDFFLDWDD